MSAHDDWIAENPRERIKDRLLKHCPVCYLCGEKIADYFLYQRYGHPYHRECLKEILEEEVKEEVEKELKDAATAVNFWI